MAACCTPVGSRLSTILAVMIVIAPSSLCLFPVHSRLVSKTCTRLDTAAGYCPSKLRHLYTGVGLQTRSGNIEQVPLKPSFIHLARLKTIK